MQTRIAPHFENTAEMAEADAILRSCVHCGFCTATCPTYQLLGDELDGPRGRIYLIKEFLGGAPASHESLKHLDRCLTCRACESTCPSGVRYARLAEIGREQLEKDISRPALEQLQRSVLRAVIPHPERFRLALQLGNLFKAFLPEALARKVPELPHIAPVSAPAVVSAATLPAEAFAAAESLTAAPVRQPSVIALAGCVQSVLTPQTGVALEQILDRLGYVMTTPPEAGCCGALSLHLNARAEAHDYMRRNIDAWWPYIAAGAEAILVSASGCGSMVKEYGEALQDDPDYAEKARQVAALARDPSEWLLEHLEQLPLEHQDRGPLAFHAPCSLQHAQRVQGSVEKLLQRAGYPLTAVADGHLCCGSAGTYSILQPELSRQLRQQKLDALQQGQPCSIATANIGCQLHLQGGTDLPVRHWLELIAEALLPEKT